MQLHTVARHDTIVHGYLCSEKLFQFDFELTAIGSPLLDQSQEMRPQQCRPRVGELVIVRRELSSDWAWQYLPGIDAKSFRARDVNGMLTCWVRFQNKALK